ncbi:hypothetical protein DERF_005589 [Dermatophagoides farinae]|uniref:Uncharacterized protein n=1 Tax=Dermatophagoides farinae TaxID=6954 RepID=A0A922I796_DERFA|nr:hypothetical protein HUG17_3439 [Dermatophagoides farinae]KAH9521985.1 hypothetical protein DERF_005589 [Dermatophagoides farinae]
MKSFIIAFVVVTLFGLTIAAHIPQSEDDVIDADQLINRAQNLIKLGQNALANHEHTEKNHEAVEEIEQTIKYLTFSIRRLKHDLCQLELKVEQNLINNFEKQLHESIEKL